MNSPLIVITGPTASGKSALAMKVAKEFGGEIICADSRTVYKGMDIGTAKPTPHDQLEVPHHLLDIVEPDQAFSAAEFKRLAEAAIADIASRDKLPIMVGGTGLYIDVVIFDYKFGTPADPELRAELQGKSVEELQGMCVEQGVPLPTNKQNKRHLVRALEVGGIVSQEKRLRPNTLVTAIEVDKETLRQRVEKRASEMFNDGAVEEAKHLAATYGWGSEAMKGNIYHILKSVVMDGVSLEKAQEFFIISDMQLAKKQMTWFRRNPYIIWGNAEQVKKTIEHFIHQNKISKSI